MSSIEQSPLEPPVDPPRIAAPTISNGTSSYMAIAVAVLSGVAAIVAGLHDQDLDAAAGAAMALLTTLGLLGSKAAQSVAVIRATARAADPYIDALQDVFAVHGPEEEGVVGDDVADSELHGEPRPLPGTKPLPPV